MQNLETVNVRVYNCLLSYYLFIHKYLLSNLQDTGLRDKDVCVF